MSSAAQPYGRPTRQATEASRSPFSERFSQALAHRPLAAGRAGVYGRGHVRSRRRNAHRVALLALFHALEGHDTDVTAQELSEVLFGAALFAQFGHLEKELHRLTEELQGGVDEQPGADKPVTIYRFERVHRELHAVHHARQTVDLDRLAVRSVVFDASKENAAARVDDD